MKRIIYGMLFALFCLGLSGCGYNRIQSNDEAVIAAWGDVEAAYQRRADLIPNLIESVKGYMGHERGVLDQVTELRTKSQAAQGVADKARVEGAMGAALANLFAVAENYPDLKASQNFMELQKSLADIEDQVQLARRYYNGAARNFNILIQSFPSNLIASAFKFTTVEYFEIEDAAERAVPKVAFP